MATKISSSDAIPTLESIDYYFRSFRKHGDSWYSEFQTTSGLKRVKIHARQSRPNERYPCGICIPLLGVVDEWAMYFEDESFLYVVPDDVFSKSYEESCRDGNMIKQGQVNQWRFNLKADIGIVETPYINISTYRHNLRSA